MPCTGMFCNNCGKPIPDGQQLCPECQARMEADRAPAQEEPMTPPVQPEAQGSFSLNTEPPRKKRPVGKIVLITAIVLALVAVLGVVLWKTVLSRVFSSPRDQWIAIEEESFARYQKALENYAGDVSLNSMDTAMTADMHIRFGDLTLSSLQASLAQQGIDADWQWLSDISIKIRSEMQGDRMQLRYGIGLGQQDVATLCYLLDLSKPLVYLGIPELSNQYLSMDPAWFAQQSGIVFDPQTQLAQARQFMAALPSADAIEKSSAAYKEILLSGIQNVKKSKEVMEVGGISQKLTVLEWKLTEEELLDICIAIFEHAAQDETMLQFLNAYLQYYQQFIDLDKVTPADLNNAIAFFQEEKKTCDAANYLILRNYVDRSNRIVGRNLQVFSADSDENMELYYITVSRNEKTAFAAKAGTFKITGDAVRSYGKVNGQYTISVGGKAYAELEVVDFDAKQWEQNAFIIGTIRLKPTKALIKDVFGISGSMASMVTSADAALELVLNATGEETSMEYNLVVGSDLLMGLSMQFTLEPPSPISLPEQSIAVKDDADIEKWVSGLNFTTLLSNLEKAGVPTEFVRQLEGLLAGAQVNG